MRTPLPWTVTGLLVIASIAAATAAAEEEPAAPKGTLLHQYFSVDDGMVVLAKEPPLVKEPGTWTLSGTFNPREGLKLQIPIENVDPLSRVVEDQGVSGWISYSFSMKSSSTTIFGPGSGSFAWNLVEGARTSKLVVDCRYNDPYYCKSDKKEIRYAGTFPGHGPDARPHSHGNETHRTDGLEAREFSWLLTYTVPPCSTLSCPALYGTYQYTFNLLVDGTTFVEYWVDGSAAATEPVAEEEAEAPADPVPAAGNSTDNGTEPANPEGGNSTNNHTSGQGSSSNKADAGFGPQSYNVQPQGKSPGLPLAGLVVALLAGLAISRRRRA